MVQFFLSPATDTALRKADDVSFYGHSPSSPVDSDDQYARVGFFKDDDDRKTKVDDCSVDANLLPVELGQQSASVWFYLAFWAALALSVQTLVVSTSLFGRGFVWWHVLLVIFGASLVVSVPFLVLGSVGVQLRVPTAIHLRTCFGVRGAVLVGIVRALFASVAFGMFTWLGAQLLYAMVVVWNVGIDQLENVFPSTMQITSGQAIAFAVFWLLNVLAVMAGWRGLQILLYIKAVLLSLFLAVLLVWAGVSVQTLGPLFHDQMFQQMPGGPYTASATSTDNLPLDSSPATFLQYFFASVASMSGFWFLFSMNISDYTRYAKSNKHQLVGQSVGIPFFTTLVAFFGMLLVSFYCVFAKITTWSQFQTITLPQIYAHMQSPVLASFVSVLFAFATLVANVVMNLRVAGLLFANVYPPWIGARSGYILSAIIGALSCPWYLNRILLGASTLVSTIGTMFSGVIGIMMADYAMSKVVDTDELVRVRPLGRYWYSYGFNVYALLAWLIAIAINLPGMLATFDVFQSDWLVQVFFYAWWIGVVVGGLVYAACMKWFARGYYRSDEEAEMWQLSQMKRKSSYSEGTKSPRLDANATGELHDVPL